MKIEPNKKSLPHSISVTCCPSQASSGTLNSTSMPKNLHMVFLCMIMESVMLQPHSAGETQCQPCTQRCHEMSKYNRNTSRIKDHERQQYESNDARLYVLFYDIVFLLMLSPDELLGPTTLSPQSASKWYL